MKDIQALAEKVLGGDRRALAQAITLVESTRPDHQEEAGQLLEILAASGRQALRIGLSGTPGVGKSTFIEAFGKMLTGKGFKIAVLAVDPSSVRSGGSILGDKTRMERLSRDPLAYIRPSPSQRELGGVARRTREVVAICEAAGFDIVLIETVGVGQSETLVASIADIFVLLIAPAGGDELQGVKRGIMEMADLILVNKADGELKSAATRTAADYSGALALFRKKSDDAPGFPKVLLVSALDGTGLTQAWDEMAHLDDWRLNNGIRAAYRKTQALVWFEEEVQNELLSRMSSDHNVLKIKNKISNQVGEGQKSPRVAAGEFLNAYELKLKRS